MPFKLGDSQVAELLLGDPTIKRAWLGDVLLFDISEPLEPMVWFDGTPAEPGDQMTWFDGTPETPGVEMTWFDQEEAPTFADEFSTFSLDTALDGSETWAWKFVGWNVSYLAGNNDRAYKTWADGNPPQGGDTPAQMGIVPLHEVSDGTLKLYGRINPEPENWDGREYLGGMITGELTQAHLYGAWEVRARCFASKGHHWAIWMVTDVYSGTGAWPEIDLVEIVNTSGSTNRLFMNSHGSERTPKVMHNDTVPPSDVPAHVPMASTEEWRDWHVYRFVWTDETMEWWIDGVLRMTCENFLFDPMYLMITPEIGGNWPGAPDGTTEWPMWAEVDYVKYWSDAEPSAVIANDDNFAMDTNDTQEFHVLANDFYAGTPTISIVDQSGVGSASVTGTGEASRIEVVSGGTEGTKTVTYELTATGSPGSDEATLTVEISEPTGTLFEDDWTGSNGASWDSSKWPTIEVTSSSVVDIQDNQGRMAPGGASFARARAVAASGTLSDFDLLIKFTVETTAEQYHSIFVRTSGGFSGNNVVNGYRFMVADGFLVFSVYTAGSQVANVDVGKTWGNDQWQMRIRCEGSSLRVRAWQGSEPGSWDIDETNSAHASGDIRIVSLNGTSTTTRPVRWDDLVVTDV